jgi:hypothetical protein
MSMNGKGGVMSGWIQFAAMLAGAFLGTATVEVVRYLLRKQREARGENREAAQAREENRPTEPPPALPPPKEQAANPACSCPACRIARGELRGVPVTAPAAAKGAVDLRTAPDALTAEARQLLEAIDLEAGERQLAAAVCIVALEAARQVTVQVTTHAMGPLRVRRPVTAATAGLAAATKAAQVIEAKQAVRDRG